MSTYSFTDVSCTLLGPGGTISLGNGAGTSDEGISITMLEDKTTMTVGADGSIMHSLHAGKGADIVVRLLKTSPTNAQLSQLYQAQSASSVLWGKNVIKVSDTSRGDIVAATDVAFARHSPLTYGKDANMNEWTFKGSVVQLLGTGINV
jgi:spore coat protein U-like protein